MRTKRTLFSVRTLPLAWLALFGFCGSAHAKSEHISRVEPYAATLESWTARAAAVRQGILNGAQLNPLPARTPLNPIFSHLRMRDGYSVENAAFEATPGFFVTGNLYRPLHRDGQVPGILLAHGHFGNWGGYARANSENQALAIRLAQMGAVVFAYDMVGWGDSQQVSHDDRRVLRLQTWNSIRAIDFLESLEDRQGNRVVDLSRIGVTGASGGGTQTMYVSAVDPRVAAAMPVVMISAGYTGNEGCEDGMPTHTVPGQQNSNNTEIMALMAPKPTMFVSDGDDWTQWFPKDEFPYVQKIYGHFGARDQTFNVHLGYEGHDYGPTKRRAAYDFFAAVFGLERLPNTSSDALVPEGVVLERTQALKVFVFPYSKPSIPMTRL